MHYALSSTMEMFECGLDAAELQLSLRRSGGQVYTVIQPEKVIVPYHRHKNYETIVVLEGRVKFEIEEEPVIIGEGDVLTINPLAIHTLAALDNRPAKLLLAFLPPAQASS